MKRLARTLLTAALLSAALNVCWMPASMCAAPQKSKPACHQTQDESTPAKSCCGGSHAALTQADVNQAPVLEASFFVVAVLSSEQLASPSVSWSVEAPSLSPPADAPPEPSLGRAPPVVA